MRRISLAGLSVACALSSMATVHAQPLVHLRQITMPGLVVDHPLRTGSAIFTNYDDSGAVQRAWHVWLRYRGCSAISAGTIRLTVYRMLGSQSVSLFISHVPRGAIQYSRPVTLKNTSGYKVYVFTAAPKSTYYYKVQILGDHPCASWGIGATTN